MPAELLRAFDAAKVRQLVERTIREQKSIGNLHQSLRDLGRRPLPDEAGRSQLHLFEERLGVNGFWRLVLGVGNLNHLAFILDSLHPAFRAQVLAARHALGRDDWMALARKGSVYDLARFARDSFALLPDETAARFRYAFEQTATAVAEMSTWSEVPLSPQPTTFWTPACVLLCSPQSNFLSVKQPPGR